MLVPAGMLVLIVLAGITFDFAHLYLAQRELASVAESVANDAATYAVDQGMLRSQGRIVFDQGRAEAIRDLAVANPPSDLRITSFDVIVDAATGTVLVSATAEVDPVFLRAVPGEAVPRTVRATARAVIAA
ncbi:MAG: hypothetical protein ACR2LQ_11070 [Acidimicrobiales bacterium]